MESTPEHKAMHRKLGFLAIAVFIDLLGFSLVIPLITQYVITALGETAKQGTTDLRVGEISGWLIAVYALMQFLFAPLWGRVSDRVGRKPILLMSLIGDAVFYTLFGLSQHFLIGLFAARILAGIFSSASLTVAQAYVADVTPPEQRSVGLGMVGAVFGVGFILGPAFGGFLGHYDLGLPLYVASGLAVINLIYIALYLPESRSKEERDATASNASAAAPHVRLAAMTSVLRGPVGFLYLLTFLVTFAFANLEGTFTTYLTQHFGYASKSSVNVAGGVFAYVGVIIVLVQGGLIRPLIKRYGEAKLILAGVFLMAVGFLLFPLPSALKWLLIGPMFPIAFGNGLNSPSLRGLVSRKSAASAQGASLGLSTSFDSLARFLGPATGAFLYKNYGQGAPYWFAGGVMGIAFLFALSQYRNLNDASQPSGSMSETIEETDAPAPMAPSRGSQ